MTERFDDIGTPIESASSDIIHYIVMSVGLFARKYKLTKKEACNYLSRFKGLDFTRPGYRDSLANLYLM